MENPEVPSGILAAIGVYVFFLSGIGILMLISQWKIFTKAGKPGWATLVPIYNALVFLEVAGKPGYWLLLYCIPLVNIYFIISTYVGLAERFGKDTGYAVGLLLVPFVFFPMLAFGSATYTGNRTLPAGAQAQLPGQASGSM